MVDVIGLALVVLGALLVFISGVGILRLQDVYLRMSATAKSATLGAGLLLIGLALIYGGWGMAARVLAIVLFLLLTAPIGAQAIGQAAYFSGVPFWEGTGADELDAQPAPEAKAETQPPSQAGARAPLST